MIGRGTPARPRPRRQPPGEPATPGGADGSARADLPCRARGTMRPRRTRPGRTIQPVRRRATRTGGRPCSRRPSRTSSTEFEPACDGRRPPPRRRGDRDRPTCAGCAPALAGTSRSSASIRRSEMCAQADGRGGSTPRRSVPASVPARPSRSPTSCHSTTAPSTGHLLVRPAARPEPVARVARGSPRPSTGQHVRLRDVAPGRPGLPAGSRVRRGPRRGRLRAAGAGRPFR